MLVNVLQLFPLLLVKVEEAIQSFDRFEWSFIHAVSASNHIDVAIVEYSHSMGVSGLFEVTDLSPFVLANVVDFTFLRSLIRVL